jgi:hypothetical protein
VPWTRNDGSLVIDLHRPGCTRHETATDDPEA